MSEQLYRIEIHPNGDTNWVPYVPVRDLGWACREMIRNPMREYKCDESCTVSRWHPHIGRFEYRILMRETWERGVFTNDEIDSTSWHAVEEQVEETPEPPAEYSFDPWRHEMTDNTRYEQILSRLDALDRENAHLVTIAERLAKVEMSVSDLMSMMAQKESAQ